MHAVVATPAAWLLQYASSFTPNQVPDNVSMEKRAERSDEIRAMYKTM